MTWALSLGLCLPSDTGGSGQVSWLILQSPLMPAEAKHVASIISFDPHCKPLGGKIPLFNYGKFKFMQNEVE